MERTRKSDVDVTADDDDGQSDTTNQYQDIGPSGCKTMEISSLDPTYQKLIRAAMDVKQNAYCPYSNFRVGAAVLCHDGNIFTGCNVENASYGLCVCAERNAVMAAVGQGYRNFTAAAVSCDIKGNFKGPCGVCRQVFIEFGTDIDLYLTKPDMTYKKVCLKDLLPMAFTPASLEEERIIQEKST